MIRLADDLPSILAMTEAAVGVDSGTYHVPGVQEVIGMWAAHLAGSGFAVERTPLPGRGDQLTARRAFGSGRRILVLGRADTVWPAGTAADWPFRNDGTFLTGPGVGGMKANVVVALHALRRLVPGASIGAPPHAAVDPTWSDPAHPMVGIIQDNVDGLLGFRPPPRVPAYVYGPSPEGLGGPDEGVKVDEFLHVVRTHAISAWRCRSGS